VAGAKPVIPSLQALRDIDEALAHYIAEAGDAVALRFIDALDAAFEVLGRQPGIGSPRYAHELNLPGLRSWPLTGFPQLLLYMEHDDAVDVARVLHGASDIPAALTEPEA